MDVELYFGKGLFSPKLYKEIQKSCHFNDISSDLNASSVECRLKLLEMDRQVGPHNVYNIYDNCPRMFEFLHKVGKDMGWLRRYLRANLHNMGAAHQELTNMNGGYDWSCAGDVGKWIKSPEVMKALHLDNTGGGSLFFYKTSGPASITLYPELVKKLRVLIYNGDADACVPYIGNEEWISTLETRGILKETSPWTPWFTSSKAAPAGYITRYHPQGADGNRVVDFAFQTIRLAGHMVPQFQPEAAFVMFSQWLKGATMRNDVELLV